MKTKSIQYDDEVCGSFVVTDYWKIIDVICDFQAETKEKILTTLSDTPEKDVLIPLFNEGVLDKDYTGFIYRYGEQEKEFTLTFVYSDIRVSTLHFLMDHADEVRMNQDLVSNAVKAFVKKQDISFFENRKMNGVIEELKEKFKIEIESLTTTTNE